MGYAAETRLTQPTSSNGWHYDRGHRVRICGVKLRSNALQEGTYSACVFDRVDLEGMIIECDLRSCSFVNCTFYWGFFNCASLSDVGFVDCTFPGTSFVGSEFANCRFERCKFSAGNMGDGCEISECRFTDCRFELCDWTTGRGKRKISQTSWWNCKQNSCVGLEGLF